MLQCQGQCILFLKSNQIKSTKNKHILCMINQFRKTRPKSNRLNHHETDDYVKINCKYISIWMCVTLSGAWLFSLSYMLAIVHSEYHELNKDVKKRKYAKHSTMTQLWILCILKINWNFKIRFGNYGFCHAANSASTHLADF